MSPPTKTTPKPSKPNQIHHLTPTQTTQSPPLPSSAPPRRRSLRLASISSPEPPQSPTESTPEPTARVSKAKKTKMQKSNLTASKSEPILHLRSGKKVLKRGITITNENDSAENNTPKRNKIESNQNEEESSQNEGESSQRRILTREEKGEEKLKEDEEPVVGAVVVDDENVEFGVESEIENNLEEKNEELNVLEQTTNTNNNNAREERCQRRNKQRFHDIARKVATGFAHFPNEENDGGDLCPENEQEKNETENEEEPVVVAVGDENVEFGVELEIENNVEEKNEELNVLEQTTNANSNNAREMWNVLEQFRNANNNNNDREERNEELNVLEQIRNANNNNAREENNEIWNVVDQIRNANNNNAGEQRGRRRNMQRFHDIARRIATRFAHFPNEENDGGGDLCQENEQEKNEIEIEEDWPGPFSTAMKIIKDREKKAKGIQIGDKSKEKNLVDSIKWKPKSNSEKLSGKLTVPSLQELCIRILAKNVDAIVSLDGVPDPLRHRLSQLLCDSRRMNDHFFELLVGGTPTEIRLRDCSWLSEEHFTKCFEASDTSNLVVLQLDQCGRLLPNTLVRSPKQLPKLTSLSLGAACRLSDVGLRSLVSSTPMLRSINLSQCSLLTSASLYILAESLKSLLKELYLDHCFGIDAALIVPALVEFEHLEVLSVVGIPTVCDTFVKDYIVARGHNMKELNLKDCESLTDASIKVVAENCPGICGLDLSNLGKLTDLSMGYLTNGCRALQTLKLCRNPFSDEAIAAYLETNGESLIELSLNNVRKVGYHTTLSLASHAKNLHSLDVSWCRNLTDNALGLIVDSCLSLRLLKLFGCTQVTDVFLNGHSNSQIQLIGLKMTSVLQHVKLPDPHQSALNYSSVSIDLAP